VHEAHDAVEVFGGQFQLAENFFDLKRDLFSSLFCCNSFFCDFFGLFCLIYLFVFFGVAHVEPWVFPLGRVVAEKKRGADDGSTGNSVDYLSGERVGHEVGLQNF
jgi:hypothetical protein